MGPKLNPPKIIKVLLVQDQKPLQGRWRRYLFFVFLFIPLCWRTPRQIFTGFFGSCETERKEACGRRKHEPEREAAGRETKQSRLARTEAARWLSARAAEWAAIEMQGSRRWDTEGPGHSARKVSGAHFLSSADHFRQYLTHFRGENVVGNEFGQHNQKFQAQQWKTCSGCLFPPSRPTSRTVNNSLNWLDRLWITVTLTSHGRFLKKTYFRTFMGPENLPLKIEAQHIIPLFMWKMEWNFPTVRDWNAGNLWPHRVAIFVNRIKQTCK